MKLILRVRPFSLSDIHLILFLCFTLCPIPGGLLIYLIYPSIDLHIASGLIDINE